MQQGYGLTETSPVAHFVSDKLAGQMPGSIGPPVPNTEPALRELGVVRPSRRCSSELPGAHGLAPRRLPDHTRGRGRHGHRDAGSAEAAAVGGGGRDFRTPQTLTAVPGGRRFGKLHRAPASYDRPRNIKPGLGRVTAASGPGNRSL